MKTKKLNKAIELLEVKTGRSKEYIIDFFSRNGIYPVVIYKGLNMMSYVWNGEEWLHVHKFPSWYYRLRG